MKSLLTLSIFFLTHTTVAAPVVGDLVRYQMTINSGTSSEILEQKIEVSEVDTKAGTFSTQVTILSNGNVVSTSKESSDLNSANDAETTLDQCNQMPADMAKIETIFVPAGKFRVCHIKLEQDGLKMDHYFGHVLFGLVKSITFDNSTKETTTFELIEAKKH